MEELDKNYYRIKDVSEITGISESSIRYWEKEFDELNPRRSAGNTRYYSPKDIELLKLINYLVRDKGLKLDAAREQIRKNRTNISRKTEIIELLENTKSELTELLKAFAKRK